MKIPQAVLDPCAVLGNWAPSVKLPVTVLESATSKDLASGPRTRLDHSRALSGRSFITVKKEREKSSDTDIRRGWGGAPR